MYLLDSVALAEIGLGIGASGTVPAGSRERVYTESYIKQKRGKKYRPKKKGFFLLLESTVSIR